MKYWTTEIKTADGKTWMGPYIQAISHTHAQQYCNENGLGYCVVVGQLVKEDTKDFYSHELN